MTPIQDFMSRDNIHFYGARGADILLAHQSGATILSPIEHVEDLIDFLSNNPGVCVDGEVLIASIPTIRINAISGKTKNYDQTRLFAQMIIPISIEHYMKGLIIQAEFSISTSLTLDEAKIRPTF